MDKRLHARLEKIEESIAELEKVEAIYLRLKAEYKPLFSNLFLAAPGKNVAEKEAAAYVQEDWLNFTSAQVDAEVAYNKERRMYELRLKAYDAEHLTFKNEAPAIKRQGA